MSILTGGFSPFFAYVLTLLGEKRDIPVWAWIFVRSKSTEAALKSLFPVGQIIEGAITIVFGVVSWFFIPDFPDQNTFLTKEETKFVLERVERDRGDSIPDELTLRKTILHLCDWRMWAFGKSYFMNIWDTKSPNNRRRPDVFLRNSSSVCHWVDTVDTIPLGIDAPSIRFFITIILRSMGWSVQQSLLLVGFFYGTLIMLS